MRMTLLVILMVALPQSNPNATAQKPGTLLWEFNPGGWVIGPSAVNTCSPASGTDGTIYVGSVDHKVYALDRKTGIKKWDFKTGAAVWSSPAIGTNGTLYVGSADGKVYAIKTDSKGLAQSPWPMRGQNAQHTGRAAAAVTEVEVKAESVARGKKGPKHIGG